MCYMGAMNMSYTSLVVGNWIELAEQIVQQFVLLNACTNLPYR